MDTQQNSRWNHGADGEQVVAHQEILPVHNAHAQGLHAAPQVVAQQTGQAQQEDEHQIGQYRPATGDTEAVHPAGEDILKHGGYGGQGGKEQENEKQRAPELAARHGVEHIGQGHKDQAGALAGVDAESEGGGEDDQAGDKGNAGVQNAHVDGLAEQAALLADVAAENGHGANTQAEGEEGLSHGVIDGAEQPKAAVGIVQSVVEVGHQVELHALHGTGKGEGADGQHYQQGQQAEHHGLVDLLHAVFQAAAAISIPSTTTMPMNRS